MVKGYRKFVCRAYAVIPDYIQKALASQLNKEEELRQESVIAVLEKKEVSSTWVQTESDIRIFAGIFGIFEVLNRHIRSAKEGEPSAYQEPA